MEPASTTTASAAAAPPAGGHAKHYVFVDEYNRHKRLKVMRACDGCRKRKIRCDGALQNGPWPCGACVRLKLKCVPPSLDQDDEINTAPLDGAAAGGPGSQSSLDLGRGLLAFQPVAFPGSTTRPQGQQPQATQPYHHPAGQPQLQMQHLRQLHQLEKPQQTSPLGTDLAGRPPPVRGWSTSSIAALPTPTSLDPNSIDHSASANAGTNAGGPTMYSTGMFGNHLTPRLQRSTSNDDYLGVSAAPSQQFSHASAQAHAHIGSTPPRSLQLSTGLSPTSSAATNGHNDPEDVEAAVKELSDQMGDLTIDHLSVAPWIAKQKKGAGEAQPVEEADALLPPSVFTDAVATIPPEMMPSDARCLDYFGYFFAYIHPYVPVLNRRQFYHTWRNDRNSLSPLLLEGVFACVARYLEDITEVRRWLALAARHEESFKDVPRLETIQAMLLLTKAREYVPKRGYYYRSWMAVKYMITMAFDLDLHEHRTRHAFGNNCELSRADCMTRTRIWQTLFQLEILVGAPQGRTDFSIDLETVDVSLPTPSNDVDSFEYQLSRRYAYYTLCMRNIKLTNQMWQSLRRQRKDWALDPAFQRHNDEVAEWLDTLPPDMSVRYQDDGSPPFLGGEHFVPYVHTYHWLVIIMQHRPRLQTMLEARDPGWRNELDICLHAGERMCQLQEALLNTFGLHGLQFMTRGINYSIYCVLSCLMLHLAAITSPDPEINTTARQYFTRHMRVLEHCTPGAAQDVQVQIDALREAFSADTSKPFEMKATVGVRSPSIDPRPAPPSVRPAVSGGAGSLQNNGTWQHASNPGVAASLASASVSDYDGSTGYDVLDGQGSVQSAYDPVTGAPYSMATSNSYAAHISPISAGSASTYTIDSQLSNDPSAQTPVWDPSGIFSHWNTAFGGGAPPPAPTSAATSTVQHDLQVPGQMLAHHQHAQQHTQLPATTAHPNMYNGQQSRMTPASAAAPALTPAQQQHQQQHASAAAATAALHQQQAQRQAATSPASTTDDSQSAVPMVTPHMWQDVFTNAFVSGHGQKRYRDDDLNVAAAGVGAGVHGDMYGHYSKRRG